MTSGGSLDRPSPSGLADVIETILDKGMVIDAYVRASVVGIELVTIDARIVIASVETYLRFAEAVNRLDLTQNKQKGLPDLAEGAASGASHAKTKGALEAVGEKLTGLLDDVKEREEEKRGGRNQRG